MSSSSSEPPTAINVDLQSSMLLETLRQTPSIAEDGSAAPGGGGQSGGAEGPSSSQQQHLEGGGGLGDPEKSELEAMDPAILSSTAPAGSELSGGGKPSRLRYSSEQLLGLRGTELSRRSPPFMRGPMPDKRIKMFQSLLKPSSSSSAVGDEEEYQGGKGPGSNGGAPRRMDLRDPKERLRKEDGIVLSPQRRNFNMGCQMPAAPAASTGPGLTIGSGLLRSERDLLGGVRERRIGSGRILSRDVSWDYRPDKDAPESNDYRASGSLGFRNDRNSGGGGERDSRDVRETRDARDPRDARIDPRDKDFRGGSGKNYDDRDDRREDRYERRPPNREYDRFEKDNRGSRMNSRYSNSNNNNNNDDDRDGRDNRHGGGYSSNRYNDRHHGRGGRYDHRDEEPEWFSEPTCQTDTIELRGFDDPVPDDEPDKAEQSNDDSREKPADVNDRNNNSDGELLAAAGDKTNANHSLAAPAAGGDSLDRTPGDGASDGSSVKSNVIGPIGAGAGPAGLTLGAGTTTKIAPDDDFNFEDFLKLDALPSNLLYPDLPAKEPGSGGGSRFSQWFRQENTAQPQNAQNQQQKPAPPAQQQSSLFDSRRSSLQDEINNMINDFTSAGLDEPPHPQQQQQQQHQLHNIPDSNSNKYFAPISPAANTSNNSSNSLLEFFQRSDKQQQREQREQHQGHHHPHGQHPLLGHPSMQQQQQHHQQQQQQHHQQMQNRNLQQLLGVSSGGPVAPNVGQIHSVEELEARFRREDDANGRPGGVGGSNGGPVNPPIPRLITPSSAERNGPGGPMSSNLDQQQESFKKLLAQISENQQQQQQGPPPHINPPQQQPPPHHPGHPPVSMLHQHQQQQNELLHKMLHLNQMQQHLPPAAPVNDVRQAEILKRPEAQALLHGVARGEVSQHNLWQQLANPATAQNHREIVSSVLATFGGNPSPRVVSPNILIQPSPGPGGVPILPPATGVPPSAAAAAVAAANSANLLFQHHSKQQMRLSPLPNGGMPQRIPSPRELQFHTQSIMQNALIRKKLEEQRENYRKRQEQQQQQQQQQNRNQPDSGSAPSSSAPNNSTTTTSAPSGNTPSSAPSQQQQQQQQHVPSSNGGPMPPPPQIPASTITTPSVIGSITSPAKQQQNQPPPPSQPQPPHPHHHQHQHQHTSSPTPLAFTPTSVLRKMTAEKENEQLATAVSNAAVANREERRGGGADIPGNLGLNNPLTQQQQRNLSALMGQHPPPGPPPNQQGPPPQIPHQQQHPGMGGGHHPIGVPPMGHQPQQGPLRGGNQHGQQQQPGMPGGGNIPWNLKQPHPGQQQMPQMPKPQGRPILKGGNNAPQPPQQQQQQQQPPHPSPLAQMSFASNLEFQQQMQQFQQQQSRSGNPILGSHQPPPQPPNNANQQPPQNQQQQMNPQLQQLLAQRQQQHQQQRAIRNQHMQQLPPNFRQQQQQQQSHHGQHGGQPQPGGGAGGGIINYGRDGGLSPTSNQLARWFSPELLAQASAGKLPSLNIGQAMSLEEFERNMQHSSATVHN